MNINSNGSMSGPGWWINSDGTASFKNAFTVGGSGYGNGAGFGFSGSGAYFEGDIYARNGYFSGKIEATTGKIGGWTITTTGLSGNGVISGGTITGSTIKAKGYVTCNGLTVAGHTYGIKTMNRVISNVQTETIDVSSISPGLWTFTLNMNPLEIPTMFGTTTVYPSGSIDFRVNSGLLQKKVVGFKSWSTWGSVSFLGTYAS